MTTHDPIASANAETSAVPSSGADAAGDGMSLAPGSDAAITAAMRFGFTLERFDLHQAWRRVDNPSPGGMVTLILTDGLLMLETANADADPSLCAHARVPLTDGPPLPSDQAIRFTLEGDLLADKLCNPQLHTIEALPAGGDPLVFEVTDVPALPLGGAEMDAWLRVRDSGGLTKWPVRAQCVAMMTRDPVPETAVALDPRSLAKTIDLARRLVRLTRGPDAQAWLVIGDGAAWIHADLGFCVVRRHDLAGLDLRIERRDLAPLAGVLASHAVPGHAWSVNDHQMLRFGDEGCTVRRGSEVSTKILELLDEPSRAAFEVKVADLRDRLDGLLRQSVTRDGEAAITLFCDPEPTVRVAVPVVAGEATYTFAATWIGDTAGTGTRYEGRIAIAALLALISGRTSSSSVVLHLHGRSLELREALSDGELRAFVAWAEPPPAASAKDVLDDL